MWIGVRIAVAMTLLAAGCGIDDRDLEKASRAYHLQEVSAGRQYRLLSSASRAALSEREFDEFRSDLTPPSSLRVLGEDEKDGRIFGRVELEFKGACSNRTTHSWVKEDGRWRVLEFPKLKEKGARQFAAGDYSTALQTADERLKLDPFSIDALQAYLFAQDRTRKAPFEPTVRSSAEIVRSMLAINREDDTALFVAASYSDGVGVSKSFFERLAPDSCSREPAAFNVMNKLSTPQEQLAFLDGTELESVTLVLRKVAILDALGRGSEALAALKENGDWFERRFRSSDDPSFDVIWAVQMGVVAARNGDDAEARRWLNAAALLDPQDKALSRLDRRLNDSCCNQLSVRISNTRILSNGWGGTNIVATVENLSPVTLKSFWLRGEIRAADGTVIDKDFERRSDLAPGQTRDVQFGFSASKSRVASAHVVMNRISVEGLEDEDATFWVRVVPEVSTLADADP